jgi:hypothetical protein
MKTKIDPIQHATKRLEKLRLYNYLAHKAVYPSSYGLGGAEPTEEGRRFYCEVDERTRVLTQRILGRLPGVCDTTVSWAPQRRDTYVVAQIVKNGADADVGCMEVPLEVAGWEPIPIRADCEGGQGWIYCPKDLAEEVARRLNVLDSCDPDTYSYTELHGVALPPADMKVRMGYELNNLVKKGQHKAPAMRIPGEAAPARKISDSDAMDQIAELVLNVSHDMEGMCHKLEEIVLKTGRRS